MAKNPVTFESAISEESDLAKLHQPMCLYFKLQHQQLKELESH